MTSSNTVYPLAFPKGTKYLCELCQKPAHKICDKCRVTYYCDIEHQQSDWYGIHEKICQSLIPLRAPQPFLPSEEERKKRQKEIKNKKIQLIEFTRSISQRYLFEGEYQRAIPGAMTSLKLVIEIFGLKSVDLVPSYLILGEASQGLGSYAQAQEYLSQAEWTVMKNPNCPDHIYSKLYRNIAMLQITQGNFEQALRNLANDIYHASEEYGTEHIRVSGGYFLMGNIFFKLNKMDVADSLYRQVSAMWYTHLKAETAKRTEISELEAILGKKNDEDLGDDSIDPKRSSELASEAEARKVLHAIYEIRRNENKPDEAEINQIEHSLSMIHFLSNDLEKFQHFTNLLMSKPEVSEDVKAELQKVTDFVRRGNQ